MRETKCSVCEAFGVAMEFLGRGCARIDEDGGLGGGETPLEARGGRRLCIGDILPASFFDDNICKREGDEGRRLVVAGGRGVLCELEPVGGGGRVRQWAGEGGRFDADCGCDGASPLAEGLHQLNHSILQSAQNCERQDPNLNFSFVRILLDQSIGCGKETAQLTQPTGRRHG